MDKNNSLVKAPTTSIQRVGRQLAIVNKLMAERDKRLLEWWNGLDDLWQGIFLINLELFTETRDEQKDIFLDFNSSRYSIFELHEKCFNKKFVKPQDVTIEQIKSINRLAQLYFDEVPIVHIEPLRNLINLKKIYAWDTQITSLEPLEDLINLEELDIADSQIISLEPLKKLTKLKKLWLNGLQIATLEQIKNLNSLEVLEISCTKITNIEPLYNFKNLEELACSNTPIKMHQVVAFQTTHPDCWIHCRFDKTRWEEAVEVYKDAIRTNPNVARLYSRLGDYYSMLERHSEAIEAYKEAIRINPDDAVAYNNLGTQYLEHGQHNEAIQAFTEAIRIKPDDAYYEFALELAQSYNERGQHEETRIEQQRNQKAPQELPSSKILQGKKILIVDNELGPRESIRIIVKNHGATAVTAEDGYKALEILKNNSFDLITTEIYMPMPGLRGIDLIKEIKARGRSTPIIVINGSFGQNPNIANLTAKLGVFVFISKPFNPNDLISAINKALER